ncbi:MAG: hypothetical protein ACK40G_10130 [Cytophagaceae bacterium]
MNFGRTVLFLVYRKRNYTKLLIPVLFLLVELSIAGYLKWELFGEWYNLPDKGYYTEASIVHNPIIVIKAIHSDRITTPFPGFESPQIGFRSNSVIFTGLCYLISLSIAYFGILMSFLWIKRFFNRNNLNPIWWIWPSGCIGAHLLLFFIANSHLSNLILCI